MALSAVRWHRMTSVAVLTALLTACGNSASPVTSTTTDSAGVRITTSSAPAFTEATRWTVDTTPIVDIGSDTDTTAQFDDVPAALLVGDTIIVADGSDLVLRYFDLRGNALKTVGRKGAGPGEYENIRTLERAGDSLLIHDAQQERATLLHTSGSFGRTFRVQRDAKGGTWSVPIGRWRDGRFLLAGQSGVSSAMPVGPVSRTFAVMRYGASGAFDTLLKEAPGGETVAITSRRFVSDLEPPYARHTIARFHPDGFWLGTADAARIDRFDRNGRLAASLRWSAPDVRISPSEQDDWRTDRRAGIASMSGEFAELKAAIDQAVGLVDFPASRPPYRTFLVNDTHLWVQRVPAWSAQNVATEWDVFDANGAWLGLVNMPARVVPLDIAGDRIVALWRDDNDVPHVRVYRVTGR